MRPPSQLSRRSSRSLVPNFEKLHFPPLAGVAKQIVTGEPGFKERVWRESKSGLEGPQPPHFAQNSYSTNNKCVRFDWWFKKISAARVLFEYYRVYEMFQIKLSKQCAREVLSSHVMSKVSYKEYDKSEKMILIHIERRDSAFIETRLNGTILR